MALYENPGTNFHDLNLDWLIGKMKELIAQWAETEQDWEGVQAIIDSLPASIDAYYSDPEHPRDVPTSWTEQAQQLVDAAVTEEAGYREDEDDRLSDEITEGIAQEVTNRNNAIGTALQQAKDYADAAITSNNTTVVNPIAQSVQTEKARAEGVEAGLDTRLDTVEAAVVGLQGAVRLVPSDNPDVANGAYSTAGGLAVGDVLNLEEPGSGAFRAKIFTASPFEVFCVSGNSTSSNVPLVIFLDTNNTVLAIGDTSTGPANARFGVMYYAPPNTAKIICQEYRSSSAATYFYRGILSPYSRIMFGGPNTLPNITTGGRVFKYTREDKQSQQGLTYPFEMFKWSTP